MDVEGRGEGVGVGVGVAGDCAAEHEAGSGWSAST
jgi:hypothetical protein